MRADQHCAINLALYQKRGGTWVLCEAGAQAAMHPSQARIAGNTATWQDGTLVIEMRDRSAPWGKAVAGTIRLRPQGPTFASLQLHPHRPHFWWPVAPCARVDVALSSPEIRWQGRAYHDANWGHEPLSAGFSGWSWQRLWHREGTLMQYIIQPRDAPPRHLCHLYRSDGTQQRLPPAAPHPLPSTRWGLDRVAAGPAREMRRLEDTPFYSRSQIAVDWEAQSLTGMHEQLNLDRFDARWVQFLLPFRMRRAA